MKPGILDSHACREMKFAGRESLKLHMSICYLAFVTLIGSSVIGCYLLFSVPSDANVMVDFYRQVSAAP